MRVSGNSFIDENHDDLLAHMEQLSLVAQQDDGDHVKRFGSFLLDLENHFAHEETILRGAAFSGLEKHIIEHREIALALRKQAYESSRPDDIAESIKVAILEHEMRSDQAFWPLFEQQVDVDLLMTWTKDLETGIEEIDAHHMALVRHINRFYLRLDDESHRDVVQHELATLYAYANYHFEKEGEVVNLSHAHRVNHERLLDELLVLKQEIQDGHFQLSNLKDYFDYWLLNHIRTFDVPEAKDSTE